MYKYFFCTTFLCLRKHAPSARCFYQMSAVSCHTSESTSTSLLMSVRSVAPAAARSTSSPTSPRTACITPEGLATGQCTDLQLGGARLKYAMNNDNNGKLLMVGEKEGKSKLLLAAVSTAV